MFDISMDIKDLHKCYELCRLPSLEVKQKSEAIDESNYVTREERNALLLNEDSDYVIIDHQFKYKGNTKITKRQRGRVRDALPALQVM